MKLCINCRHCDIEFIEGMGAGVDVRICKRTEIIDPVDGKKSYQHCSLERGENHHRTTCGAVGKFWEAML